MACSKYEYVKKFQQSKSALLETYIVIRIDGRSFTNFCSTHNFQKPNDKRAINLMNQAALYVCNNFQDIFLAYGQSDQYSFALNKNTTLFSRRNDKILSTIVSTFSSSYVFNWSKFFDIPLKTIPTFDSRIVLYPNQKSLKDYFRWRQVDCHINNLYNTTFWLMVKSGKSNTQVENLLKDTNSGQKNQILFSQFGINYSQLPQMQKKGNIICYKKINEEEIVEKKQQKQSEKSQQTKKQQQQFSELTNKVNDLKMNENQQFKNAKKNYYKQKNAKKKKQKLKLQIVHQDLIHQQFWQTIKF